MLNHIILMGRLTRDPELRHIRAVRPSPRSLWRWTAGTRRKTAATGRWISSTALRGVRPENSFPSISPKVRCLPFPEVCRSASGPTGKATNAARPKWYATMPTSPRAGKAGSPPDMHPERLPEQITTPAEPPPPSRLPNSPNWTRTTAICRSDLKS